MMLPKQLMTVLNPFWRKLLIAGLFSGLSLFMAIALLAASSWLISMASTRPPILTLMVAIVGVRFFGLSRGFLRYVSRLLEHDAALSIQGGIRQEFYKKLESFSPSQFNLLRRGHLLRQSITQTEEIQDLWLRMLLPWLSTIIAAIAGISIIKFLLPSAAVVISLIFITAVTIITFSAVVSSVRVKYRNYSNQLFDQIMQSCESAQESQIFGFDSKLQSQIDIAQTELNLIDSKDSITVGVSAAMQPLFTALAVIGGAIYSTNAYSSGSLAGVNVAVITLLPIAIFDNLSSIPAAFSRFRQHFESLLNIEEFLVTETKSSYSYYEKSNFENLTFEKAAPIISEVDFETISASCSKNNPLVITGASGSGKSSIINCVLGFLPYSGSIRLGNQEVSRISPEVITSNITTLLQNDFLFNSSIRENLRIGNPIATDEQLLQALTDVELSELVTSLPRGLDTHIGVYGYNFSGGEMQRIKLARALLRNTPIYLFDEPFEFLDPMQAERMAQTVLHKLKDKSVVIISHLEIFGVKNKINISKM